MILGFGSKETEQIFYQKYVQGLNQNVQKIALRKLIMIDEANNVTDLRVPPANHFEKLIGNLKGKYSIRINEQYRIIFSVSNTNDFFDVEIIDYHK